MTKSRVYVFNDFHTLSINCHLYVTEVQASYIIYIYSLFYCICPTVAFVGQIK
jgi:hypothetical protein